MNIQRIIQNRLLFVIFRWVLGFIFIYGGIEKIFEPAQFAEDITNYHILPLALVNIMAIILPWIEFSAGLLLILGICTRGSSLIILGLLILFTIAISATIIRGIDINCGCQTPWELTDKITILKLFEELIFLGMAVQVLWHPSFTLCIDRFLRKNQSN